MEARTFLGYFVWKIMILRQKIIFFPILGGAHPLSLDLPLYLYFKDEKNIENIKIGKNLLFWLQFKCIFH